MVSAANEKIGSQNLNFGETDSNMKRQFYWMDTEPVLGEIGTLIFRKGRVHV